jgi:hypothetical protein
MFFFLLCCCNRLCHLFEEIVQNLVEIRYFFTASFFGRILYEILNEEVIALCGERYAQLRGIMLGLSVRDLLI